MRATVALNQLGTVTAQAIANDSAGNTGQATTNVLVIDSTDTQAPCIKDADIVIHKITNYMLVSPTNLLWAPTSGYEPSSYNDKATRRTYESKERSLKWNEISIYPTLLESVIELQGSTVKDKMHQKMLNLLSRSIPDALLANTITGCAELDEHSELIGFINILNQLAPWPKTYPLLGERFDDLHPILIGSLPLCTNLASAFGDAVKLETLSSTEGEQVLGAVWLPEAILQEPNSRTIAQQWLVPKDQSTAPRQRDSTLGEFKVGFTARRWRELSERGMTPQIPHGRRLLHVIQPQYCLMIGIDPDDMLIRVLQDEIARELEQEIDACFTELPVEMPLVQRVWLAHKRAWAKWSFDCQEILSFIKNKFFNDVE
jgi:hypothetical protein